MFVVVANNQKSLQVATCLHLTHASKRNKTTQIIFFLKKKNPKPAKQDRQYTIRCLYKAMLKINFRGAGQAQQLPTAVPRAARGSPPAYHQHGHACGQRVEEHRGHGAAVLRARVRFAVRALVAEEALHVDREGVRVFEIVSQHHGPCHDHHLEVKHAGERRGHSHVRGLRRPRRPRSPAASTAGAGGAGSAVGRGRAGQGRAGGGPARRFGTGSSEAPARAAGGRAERGGEGAASPRLTPPRPARGAPRRRTSALPRAKESNPEPRLPR